MSREEFRNFVKAIEKNIVLKEKLSNCKTIKDFFLLAKVYGYQITREDLKYDKTASNFESLFKEFSISPLNNKSSYK